MTGSFRIIKGHALKAMTLKLKVTRCSNVVGYSLDDFLDPKNIRNKFGITFLSITVPEI